MSTPDSSKDDYRRGRQDERERCINIVQQHADGQSNLVQALLRRVCNDLRNLDGEEGGEGE